MTFSHFFPVSNTRFEPLLFLANYMNNWKCVAALKGDGTQAQSEPFAPAAPSGGMESSNQSSTTRYYKLGTISNPNQVPWH